MITINLFLICRKETSPRAKTRGSPKKWPKTNDVSSFKTNTFSNSYLFLPREIDLSVFHSLPDDLKKEVETSYRWMNAPLTISHEKTVHGNFIISHSSTLICSPSLRFFLECNALAR